MKSLFVLILMSLSFSACQPPAAPSQSSSPSPALSAPAPPGELSGALQADVQLDKAIYRPGEMMAVMVVATNLKERAWVGIVSTEVGHGQEEVNEKNLLGRLYIEEHSELKFTAPDEPGTYDVRLHDSDEAGIELARRTFTVEEVPDTTSPTGNN